MQLQINLKGKVPIRNQLVEQIKLQIASGKVPPGQQLPTVRDLALSLDVNPSTVAKAYSELERTGVIVTRRGGGSFVADRPEERFLVDSREDRLNAIASGAVLEALSLGYEPDEVEARFVTHLGRWRTQRLDAPARETRDTSLSGKLRFAGSHDVAVQLLLSRVRRSTTNMELAVRFTGSLSGLIALEQGEADLAGSHLLDHETGEYNLPFVRRLLPGQDVLVVELVERWQGLLVRRGNPKSIHGLEDITRPEVLYVNRQRGSGTRVLLDYRLRTLGINAGAVHGYERQEDTHIAVAAAIADGSADVGLGIGPAARAAELDFLPLLKERYDLVMLRAAREARWFKPLMQILADEEFRKVVTAMGGYETSGSGRTLEIEP